jgi:hypothetical protein
MHAREAGVAATMIGLPVRGDRLIVRCNGETVLDESRVELHRAWSATTSRLCCATREMRACTRA